MKGKINKHHFFWLLTWTVFKSLRIKLNFLNFGNVFQKSLNLWQNNLHKVFAQKTIFVVGYFQIFILNVTIRMIIFHISNLHLCFFLSNLRICMIPFLKFSTCFFLAQMKKTHCTDKHHNTINPHSGWNATMCSNWQSTNEILTKPS
jgi:hypothetical protein